jgi:dolichyl-phosphate beta-glucosyltransferase
VAGTRRLAAIVELARRVLTIERRIRYSPAGMSKPYLSIVIPAYDEALRIRTTLENVLGFLAQKRYGWELIVVDDGSTDGTAPLLAELAARCPRAHILRNERNRGKGFSVRRGVLEARGEFILFTDADLSSPIEELEQLFEALGSARADAAIGSRALKRELVGRRQSYFRDYSGRVFNLLVRRLTGLKFRDTQCGIKLFRRDSTRRAFQLQRSTGFGFDAELLFLIEHTGGRIVEVPVRWYNDPATKVHFVRDSMRMVQDLIRLRWRAWRGGYGPKIEYSQQRRAASGAGRHR